MTWAKVFTLGIVMMLGLFGIAALLASLRASVAKNGPPPPPPVPSRLSTMAAMSFFFGLWALACSLTALILSQVTGLSDLLNLSVHDRPGLVMAERIVLYAIMVPAVAAIGFAIGARGAIRESEGRLRGRSLYHSGLLIALLAGLLALEGKITKPDFGTRPGWSFVVQPEPPPPPPPPAPREH